MFLINNQYQQSSQWISCCLIYFSGNSEEITRNQNYGNQLINQKEDYHDFKKEGCQYEMAEIKQEQGQNQGKLDKFDLNYKNQQIKYQKEKFHKKQSRSTLSKLNFGIQWKNQNRNVVPNIVNQIVSYLLKENKSGFLVTKLFNITPHQNQWTIKKFYAYLKRSKNKIPNYMNEKTLMLFLTVQDYKYQMFSKPQQQFYILICRKILFYFLRHHEILICMTSKRMSKKKRKSHLVARRALLQWLQQTSNL